MKPLRTISNQCARLQTAGCKELAQKHGSSQVDGSKVAMCVQQRPRTRSSVTLWSLPDSVLIRVLKELHIRDLLSFRSVHPHFLNVIDANSVLWKHVSFADAWPSEKNLSHFVNAAEKKNVEAALKLAVAYLYKEGLCKEDNPDMSYESAHYFCLAEILTPEAFPFFWIFVRPPWSLDGTCCKAKTFQHIQTIAEKSKHPDLCFGTGLTLKLQRLTSQGSSKVEEMKYFNIAVANKSKAAAFFILLDIEKQMDKAKELERVRMLRLISGSVLEANLFLIRHYVQGQYGGISRCMAQEYVQSCFQFSRPSRIHITYTQGQTSDISRYILVDWLVEVLGMKEYSTHTLYLAVSMFDRFMQVRKIQRSQVQLLGVAAMVLSSRYLGFNILTIREAAWLTDNSYSYQDVVRMMGELVAALGGNLRVLNIHDYVMVLAPLVGETCQSAMLMEYLAMLCLLQSEMGQYSPAEIAASSLLLARLLLNCADPWPAVVQEWTGFSQDYLSLCTFHIYNKCLLDGSEVDYRDTKLQAVKTRYADPNRYCISKIKIIHHKELCKRLGVAKLITRGAETKAVKFLNTDELIMSPSRGGQSQDFVSIEQSFKFPFENSDRKMSATPPISLSGVHDEPGSGYDADLDDISDESMLSKLGLQEDSEFELSDSTLEESHDWEEPSLDNDAEDDENMDNPVSFSSISEHLEKYSTRFTAPPSKLVPCLSSMCQLGTKLSCYSSLSSPASCVANCWCKTSLYATASSPASSSGFLSSPQSGAPVAQAPESPGSNQVLKSPLASPGTVAQNVRACIPCGSIGKTPKRERQENVSKSSNVLSQYDTICRSKKNHPVTRSVSSQNISYCDVKRNNSDISSVAPLHLFDRSQERICNDIDRSQVNGQHFQGSKAQNTHLSQDILLASSSSASSSMFLENNLILSSSSTPVSDMSLTSTVTPNCDLIGQLHSDTDKLEMSELEQNAVRFLQSDTPKNAKSSAKHKGKAAKRMHSPITPENSMDCFTGPPRVTELQANPGLSGCDRSVHTTCSSPKKAKLNVTSGQCDGVDDSSNSLQFSAQSCGTATPEARPVLRSQRKCNESEAYL